MSVAKNIIFNLCQAFPNASRSSSNTSRLCFTTSASKHPRNGDGVVDANREEEDAKNKAAETARGAKENVKEKAKEGMNWAAETAEEAKERAKEGAKGVKEKTEEMVKEGKERVKESVMGGNGGKVVEETDVRTKAGTNFDD